MSLRERRTLVCLALVALVALAGCAGAGNDGGNADLTGGSGGKAEATRSASGGGDGEGGGKAASAVAAIQSRQLIRTGTVSVRVEDYDAAAGDLRAAANSMGGFVSDSTQRVNRRDNRSWTTGRIVFRIPADRFDEFLSRANETGEVREIRTNTEDVTDQLVDIGARLKNLRAERDRLRELYARANETEAILDVQERLSEVQGEIERLRAKQQSLRERVAYSTVTVEISERPPEWTPPARLSWYETGVLDAFLDSAGGVVVVLRALVVGFAYAAPYLLVFGLPIAALVAVGRRWRAT